MSTPKYDGDSWRNHEADPEDLYPPKPGGMVDTARKQAAAEVDQLQALADAEPAPVKTRFDVAVQDHAAELARARTFSVSTANNNPIVELLGRDEDRRSALVMTLDEPVVISFAQTAAEDPRNEVNAAGLCANGFVLPVNVPVPFPTKSVIYCTATSATATRVSVAAFRYSDG
jgi:hypothetical protein